MHVHRRGMSLKHCVNPPSPPFHPVPMCQTFSDWITQTVRVYAGQPYVDVEWVVGPVPIDDSNVRHGHSHTHPSHASSVVHGPQKAAPPCLVACGAERQRASSSRPHVFCAAPVLTARCSPPLVLCAVPPSTHAGCEPCTMPRVLGCTTCWQGKEVISRFDTNISTAGYLYTDSNGREFQVSLVCVCVCAPASLHTRPPPPPPYCVHCSQSSPLAVPQNAGPVRCHPLPHSGHSACVAK